MTGYFCYARTWLLFALVMVGMLMTNTSSRFQFAIQVILNRLPTLPLSSKDHLNVVLVEDVYSTTTHAPADDGVYTDLMQEIGQETRSMSWVCDTFTCKDLSLVGIEYLKSLAMAKMAADFLVLTSNCYSQHLLLPIFN